MAKMGRSLVRKREVMPDFYAAPRKMYVFVTNPSPGPHRKGLAYDPVTLLRDVLGLARTAWEVKKAIKSGALIVDGKAVRDYKYPIGLMDVVHIKDSELYYRMVPTNRRELYPVKIGEAEADLKILRVVGKVAQKGGRYQVTLHDSRTAILEDPSEVSIGDSVLYNTKERRIVEVYRLEQGNLALVFTGRRVGFLGRIKEIVPSTFTRRGTVKLEAGEETATVPEDYVIVVGKEKAPITVVGEER